MIRLFLFTLIFSIFNVYSQVGIGTITPHASAVLEVNSNSKGLLVPRLSIAERDAVVNPAEGLIIFNNEDKCFQYYDGNAWTGCMNTSPPVKSLVCPPEPIIYGYYVDGQDLNTSNTVSVRLTTTGITSYTIISDTVNGYYFSASGVLNAAGTYEITLQGQGTPIDTQVDTFTLSLDGVVSACTFDVEVLASAPPIRKNCYELYTIDNLVNDGVYTIDPDGAGGDDPINCYCNMTDDGGGWTLVFRHDIDGGLFASDSEADLLNETTPSLSTEKYSILSKIDDIKNDIKYEFRLLYPDINVRNHWKQTFNPRSGGSPTNPVDGYEAINIDNDSNFWGGLERSGANTFLDGSVNHSNWWYSIGSQVIYNGGMPGASTTVNKVELYIR